jgi:predicted phage tail protein
VPPLEVTVTVNEQVAWLALVSVAVHVTVVVPIGNAVPLGGVQTMLALGQLSDVVALKVTT